MAGNPHLSRIERKLDALARLSRDWRRLDTFTEVAFGIGLLLIATAVTVLTGASGSGGWSIWINLATGGLLAWLGVVLLKVPISLKLYFVDNEPRLRSFFRTLDDQKGGSLRAVRRWADTLGVRGGTLRRELQRAIFAYKIGLLWAGLALSVVAAFSLTIGFAGLQREHGTWEALGIFVSLVVVFAAIIFWRVRTHRA